MTFKKILKFGCLGLLGLFILVMVIGIIGELTMSPQEKAARAHAREVAAAKADADEKAAAAKQAADQKLAAAKLAVDQKESAAAFLRKLTLLRRALPPPDQLREPAAAAPAAPGLKDISYAPVDYAFLAQFAETGFVPLAKEDPHLWYRANVLDDVQKALVGNGPEEGRNAELARVSAELAARPYLCVFLPLVEEWPSMGGSDSKTFTSGYFRGWVVVLDFQKPALVGATIFEAKNSAKVSNTRLTVAGLPVGSGIGTAIASDFTDNFWSAANAAIDKIPNTTQ